MAERTRASIDVAASPPDVMSVIADVEDYPSWVDSITRAEVLTTTPAGRPATVRMSLRHTLISDDYVLAYAWEVPDAVSWHLVEGKLLKAMDGSYTLTPSGAGTTVTYELAVDLNLPLIGVLRRKAERTIIDGALAGLKKRVEG